jgi:hypothetical protein
LFLQAVSLSWEFRAAVAADCVLGAVWADGASIRLLRLSTQAASLPGCQPGRYTIPYFAILYYTIPYYTMLYYEAGVDLPDHPTAGAHLGSLPE